MFPAETENFKYSKSAFKCEWTATIRDSVQKAYKK
jgi:hypothetical protein